LLRQDFLAGSLMVAALAFLILPDVLFPPSASAFFPFAVAAPA
jgi:hypothetical protein